MIEQGVLKDLIEVVKKWEKLETEEERECYSFLLVSLKNFLEIPKSVFVLTSEKLIPHLIEISKV